MSKHLGSLLVAVTVASLLTACGSGDKPAETTTTESTSSTTTTAPAATAPAESAPAAEGTAAAPAAVDISKIPLSTATLGAFPYVGPLKGYRAQYGSDSIDAEFDRAYFYDGQTYVPVEGHLKYITLRQLSGTPKASELMIRRNYENQITGLGGVKVFSGSPKVDVFNTLSEADRKMAGFMHHGYSDHEVDTYVIRQADKEIWLEVQADGDDRYNLTVLSKGAMPQRTTVTPAAALKKSIDATGKATVYVNFDTDQATIKSESKPAVTEVATLLTQTPELRLAVEGHTDNAGTAAHNQQLSEQRAQAVVASLTHDGIAATRLRADGFGQSKPLADNATEEGRAKNRRVELVKL